MSMTKIEHIELDSSQASVVTASIAADYTDLYILASVRSDSTANNNRLLITFNSDSSNQSYALLAGSGSGVGNGSGTATIVVGAVPESGYTANTFGSYQLYIPNYAGSSAKSSSADGVSENNGTEARQYISSNLWDDTAAITTITFTLSAGSMVSNSTFTIFGITAGSDGTTTVS